MQLLAIGLVIAGGLLPKPHGVRLHLPKRPPNKTNPVH